MPKEYTGPCIDPGLVCILNYQVVNGRRIFGPPQRDKQHWGVKFDENEFYLFCVEQTGI